MGLGSVAPSPAVTRDAAAPRRCPALFSLSISHTCTRLKKNNKRYRAASDFTFPEDVSTLSRMSGT